MLALTGKARFSGLFFVKMNLIVRNLSLILMLVNMYFKGNSLNYNDLIYLTVHNWFTYLFIIGSQVGHDRTEKNGLQSVHNLLNNGSQTVHKRFTNKYN